MKPEVKAVSLPLHPQGDSSSNVHDMLMLRSKQQLPQTQTLVTISLLTAGHQAETAGSRRTTNHYQLPDAEHRTL